MKIPKKIRICGQDFSVFYKDVLFVDNQDLLGYCDVNKCEIYLKKGMRKEKRIEVFFHECIHAIDENMNLHLGENKVNHLTIHILSLIVNNGLDFLK